MSEHVVALKSAVGFVVNFPSIQVRTLSINFFANCLFEHISKIAGDVCSILHKSRNYHAVAGVDHSGNKNADEVVEALLCKRINTGLFHQKQDVNKLSFDWLAQTVSHPLAHLYLLPFVGFRSL